MALKDIIKEFQKLNTADQVRLKEFFTNSFASYSAIEPIFKEVSEQKHKDGYTCTHFHSNNVVRLGKYSVKGMKQWNFSVIAAKIAGKPLTQSI
jgi:hypothetical protein